MGTMVVPWRYSPGSLGSGSGMVCPNRCSRFVKLGPGLSPGGYMGRLMTSRTLVGCVWLRRSLQHVRDEPVHEAPGLRVGHGGEAHVEGALSRAGDAGRE